jgi:isocitrate dehydrogenase (NAD+)
MHHPNAYAALDAVIQSQLARVAAMKSAPPPLDFTALPAIIVGVCGGDGIGPAITAQAERVLKHLLKTGAEFRTIEGLTIERRAALGQAIPADTLDALKQCHVILKGPTTTPQKGDPWPNIESANVAMRKALDLFANVRPVQVPDQGIDWVFFRENTEGAYAVGNMGLRYDEDLSIDFTVATTQGSERIIRAAFEHAKKTGRTRVTAVTKANVIKETDGKFLLIFEEIAKEYPGIATDGWYIDIMTAKLIDEKRRRDFQIMVCPNLYGDILSDEAAEFQGGVGTAGSANIGARYAMFEAIHGSAPRMVTEGRAQYADPSSMFWASVMLLEHIGRVDEAGCLRDALNAPGKPTVTGRKDGATAAELADWVMEKL